ncbi:MAG TPA: 4a-hydroxytetrahydrobiopterin dehydratase [Candidatus Peribacteraceae bacterium]|nr:4a-hydroxytetrahydrobiopterin dehydratase [Candidatus Peribacteraceae bacterium]
MKSSLSGKRCTPCKGGAEPLSPERVLHSMSEVPDWSADTEVSVIARTYDCRNFKRALAFVNRVADLAEAEGHHPDIFIHDYRNVTISLTTHAIHGLSENDFIMAAKIDTLTR